jgi:hypothetical protein
LISRIHVLRLLNSRILQFQMFFCAQQQHTHTHIYSVGFLRARDRPIVGNFTWKHTIHTKQEFLASAVFETAVCGKRAATNLRLRSCDHLYLNLSCHSKTYFARSAMYWSCSFFNYLVVLSHRNKLSSEYPNFLTRFVIVIPMFMKGYIPKVYVCNALLISVCSFLYFTWMQVCTTCCMTLLMHFDIPLDERLNLISILYISFWNTPSPVNTGCVNYRRILQNHIFTNTEQKYMILLPFERGMFAVSLVTTTSK